ncbi:MAG: penicillin-binding protein 1C [Akkermansiaceae bacterium]|nr:penicillin-binding protein 1C [Akkermansiaceae bacterium]MCP5550853.1 penicillin-binding protein 1C [Akkermansiaceae bacterium]
MRRHAKRLLLLGLLAWAALYFAVPLLFPLPEPLVDGVEPGQRFTDRNGEPIRRLLADDLKVDRPATLDEIPQTLVDATLAAEDSRYFAHGGIDFLGVARAVRDAWRHEKFVSGASTVTQQLVKITSIDRPRSLRTKAIEAFTARHLEMTWDKNTILAAYLNRLPYGNQFTGCRAAARGYFGKPLADLSLAESAFLAGLPNKPTRFNPYRNFAGARERQLWILERLLEEQWITRDEYDAAAAEKLRLQPRGASAAFRAPHFIELARALESEAVTGRRAVKTTLDLGVQDFVEMAIDTQLRALDSRSGKTSATQAAAVVIENATGAVRALAGSRGFFDSDGGQINGAWTPRSAGSSLKPFTYVLALERGRSAATVLADVPVEYATASGVYRPVNYDRHFRGPVSIREALANSLNVPAVRLLDEMGGAPVLHRALTGGLGLTGLDPDPATYGLGLTLGNAEVRLLELTNAYACLARLGRFRPFHFVEPTQQGMVGDSTLFDRDACYLVADILSDNRARAAAFGLNSPLRFPFRVACKTGTSTDYRDNWTLGFTPEFTVGVWVGQFDNTPLQNVSGVSGAGPIFHAVMSELHRLQPSRWYSRPEGFVEAEVDPLTGKRVVPETGFLPRHTRREWFAPGSPPDFASPTDYDTEGRAFLPRAYAAWLRSGENTLADRVAPAESSAEKAAPLKIVSPLPGTVAFLDPDLPGAGQRLALRIEGDVSGEKIEWRCETLRIEENAGGAWAILRPGRHEIRAIDARSGAAATTTLAVESL